jgi:hypothetical protein
VEEAMKTMLTILSLLGLLFGSQALCDEIDGYARQLEDALKDKNRVAFLAKAVREELPVAAAPSLGDGYASIIYEIGSVRDRNNIKAWLDYIGRTLPANLGNTSGTYTITITVYDQFGKTLIAKEPIVSFQWDTQRNFLFFDKTVNEVQQTGWRGTLVSDIPITQSNAALRIGVEVYVQKDRSLDFSLFKQTAQALSASAPFMPQALLPAAAVPMIDTVGSLVNNFYSNSTKRTLVTEEQQALKQTKNPISYPITFTDSNGQSQYQLPVYISINTRQSRLVNGPLTNGKFDKDSLSVTIFANTGILIGDKSVGVAELISTSADPKFKSVRGILDTLAAGGTYGLDPSNQKERDIGPQCGNLYDALNAYLSPYDARAMFWAFNAKYRDQMKVDQCLGQQRKDELAAVGLSL